MRKLMAIFALLVFSAACGGTYETPTAPTPPPVVQMAPSVVPSKRPPTNWRADAVVTAVVRGSGGPCGWGTSPGETRAEVEWNIGIDGSSISMDEDMPNWPTDDIPYTGTLRGNEFTVAYESGPDYLKYVCQWRGATLSGRFSSDRSTFEAIENVFWGPVEGGTTVTRRWSGRSLQ
jgi:hypothetical protein